MTRSPTAAQNPRARASDWRTASRASKQGASSDRPTEGCLTRLGQTASAASSSKRGRNSTRGCGHAHRRSAPSRPRVVAEPGANRGPGCRHLCIHPAAPRFARRHPRSGQALRPGPRPSRARSIGDILSGIRGCWLVWREYSWGTIASSPQDADADDDPEDEDALAEELAAMQETFLAAVRAHMIANDDLTR